MADADAQTGAPDRASRAAKRALELAEAVAAGPAPGIPLPAPNGRAPVETPSPAAAESRVCVPCLVARGVLIAALALALVALVVIERRKAAKADDATA